MKTVAIIVNYKSADLTLQAVQSVLESASLGPVQVVVVDNSEDQEEAERLRSSLPSDVVLRVSPENVGFGRACNLVFKQFPGEGVLLINPDARLLPGCLERLQETLFSGKTLAAVSPQVFWDKELTFYLPLSYPPILFQLQAFFGSWGQQAHINRFLSSLWRCHTIKVWLSKRPVKVANLSGGLVLLKRASVREAGGLFDPRFFLYFEDTDLFLRLRKAGYSLVIEPRATAIHYYDQCGQESCEGKREYMAGSYQIFLKKHLTGWKSHVKKIVTHLKVPGRGDEKRFMTSDFTSPFAMEVPAHLHNGWLFEWSPNPTFLPAAGRFGSGPLMDFPEGYWAKLAPGQYFGRLGNPRGLGRHSQEISWMVGEVRKIDLTGGGIAPGGKTRRGPYHE